MGLDIYLEHFNIAKQDADEITLKEVKFPDHNWTPSHFRSSYNGTGFNSFCRTRYNLDGLYYIFNYNYTEEDETENRKKRSMLADKSFKPDWVESKKRADKLLKLITEDPIKNIDVSTFTPRPGNKDALPVDIFRRAYMDSMTGKYFGNEYSFKTSEGLFTLENPMSVLAVLYGQDKFYIFSEPKYSPTEYYEEAITILKEGIDYVLSQPDIENYGYYWSA